MLSHADVVKVEVLEEYNLKIFFEDGCSGNIDVSKLVPFQGVFKPLENVDFFKKVFVNSDIGTICWENGADLSPVFLYSEIKKTSQ